MFDLYQPPQSSHEPETDGARGLLARPNRCAASAGWTWTWQTLSLFHAQGGKWMLIGLAALLCNLPFQLLATTMPMPHHLYWLGAVGTFLLDVFLICGMVYGAASQVASGTLAAGSLLAGFRLKGKQVLALGLIQLIICFVLLMAISAPLAVLFGLLDASPSMQAFLQNTSMQIAALLAIGLVFVMGIMLSIGFTPSLVMLGNVSPVRALAMNVRGGMANLVPLLIYALTMLVFTCALATLFVLFVTIFPQAVTAVLKWWLGLPILIFLGVWNGLIAYAAYLSVWTDTELELELEG